MRLSAKYIDVIRQTFKEYFLPNDALLLFGSRVDDTKRGGDIDLYIETHYETADSVVEKQIRFTSQLKMRLGDQKIDVVIKRLNSNFHIPIYDVAKQEGIKLV